MILRYLSALLLFLSAALAASSTVTIFSQSVQEDKQAPAPLLQLTYDAMTLTANVSSYKPDAVSKADASAPIRVGMYEASGSKDGAWSTSALTTAASFDAKYQKHIQLYVNDDGTPWGIGFSAYLKATPKTIAKTSANGKSTKAQESQKVEAEEIVVEVVREPRGPTPILNRPVVLNPDGKVDQPEPEKTLFQRYWWVLALFLVLNLAGGGAEK